MFTTIAKAAATHRNWAWCHVNSSIMQL